MEKVISGFKVVLHSDGKVHVSKEIGHIYIAAWRKYGYFGNAEREYENIKSLNSIKLFVNSAQDQYFNIK